MNVLSATLVLAGLLSTYAAAASASPVKPPLSDRELVLATKVTIEEGKARALTVHVRRTPMSYDWQSDDSKRGIVSFQVRQQVKDLQEHGIITEDHWGGDLAFIVRSTAFDRPKGRDAPPSGRVSQVLGTAYAGHMFTFLGETWRADIARSEADGSIVLLVVGYAAPRLHIRLFRLPAQSKQSVAEPQFSPTSPMGWPRGAPLLSEHKLKIDQRKGDPDRVSLAYSDRRTVVCVFMSRAEAPLCYEYLADDSWQELLPVPPAKEAPAKEPLAKEPPQKSSEDTDRENWLSPETGTSKGEPTVEGLDIQ